MTGVGAACVMLVFEGTKQMVHPGTGIWTSHFATILFTMMVVVALSFLVQQRERRLRRELSVESKERQRAEAECRSESVARGQIEAELRHSEDRMHLAIEAAKIGFFDWDVTRDEQVWSKTAKQLLGLSLDSPANFTVLMDAVHAEDCGALGRVLTSVTPQEPHFVHEHRACWRDGTVHWIWIKDKASLIKRSTW